VRRAPCRIKRCQGSQDQCCNGNSNYVFCFVHGWNLRYIVNVAGHDLETKKLFQHRHDRWNIERKHYARNDAENDAESTDNRTLEKKHANHICGHHSECLKYGDLAGLVSHYHDQAGNDIECRHADDQ